MVIERGDFVNLRWRHLHLSGQRDQVRGGKAAEPILNQVEVLDEEITAARRVAEQRRDLLSRLRFDGPTPGRCADPRTLTFGWAHWTD